MERIGRGHQRSVRVHRRVQQEDDGHRIEDRDLVVAQESGVSLGESENRLTFDLETGIKRSDNQIKSVIKNNDSRKNGFTMTLSQKMDVIYNNVYCILNIYW